MMRVTVVSVMLGVVPPSVRTMLTVASSAMYLSDIVPLVDRVLGRE